MTRSVIVPGDGDPRHGTRNGYERHLCRCADCRHANAKIHKANRLARAQRLAPDDPRHGRRSTYNNHLCRCADCRHANAVASWEQRQRQRVAS